MKNLYAYACMLMFCLFGIVGNAQASSIGSYAADGETDLKGKALYDYQMQQLGLVRLSNKRTNTAFLTSTTAGAAKGASKTASGLSQIWILAKSGDGYTVRNANTGEYLQSDYSAPSSQATTLYIQYSPNNTNTSTQAYINISSKSDFSGQSCLNLGNDKSTLYEWSYSGDAGSDWLIELVSDVSTDDVKAHLNSMKGYVSSIEDKAYYRIISTSYSKLAYDDDGIVKSGSRNDDNLAQYWQFVKSGEGYAIKNAMTGKYIQKQTSQSNPYKTGTTAAIFYVRPVSDPWEYRFIIANNNNDTGQGLHTASSQGYQVVLWPTNADASQWAFEKAEITDEDIAAAQRPYQDYLATLANKTAIQANLNALFADKACTELKPEIAALSDQDLEANSNYAALTSTLQSMVLKVKNNTWQQFTDPETNYTADYERFFRIYDYKVYSNHTEMANSSNTYMSYSYGKLSGPTGIVANTGDVIYIYVDKTPSADCTLQVEAVSTEGVPGDQRTGVCTDLKIGMNILYFNKQAMLYIFYQANDTKKQLSLYPDIKIHIEGGQLNGYWDATRGMTNADWALLQKQLLKASPVLNLKTEHLVFAMNSDLVKKCEPKEMEGLMRVWEAIPATEDSYMGLDDFEGRLRNIWNCFSIDYQYMFATTYGTYYNESTLPQVMNYYNMTHQSNGNEGGTIWGPSHEMGHNRQAVINVVGTTESSNNVFSNINMFEQGISTTRGHSIEEIFKGLAEEKPWNSRDIWTSTRLFFQLYLYFHVQGHDPQFYPKLFKAMRKTPINKGTWDGSATYTDEEGTHTGANKTNGAYDYLRLARAICDVADADMSEFFEAYGMFVPVSNLHVGDYSNYVVTTTSSAINQAKTAMRKHSKKLNNIMFIDDRIVKHKVISDNQFEGTPDESAKGYRVNCSNSNGYTVGTAGNTGDYEEFTDNTDYRVNGCYFLLSGNTITFKGGSGCVGYKFYDLNGNLIWATNKNSTTLPSKLQKLGVENFRVVAAEANMNDVPCPYYNAASKKNYKAQVYFGNKNTYKTWRFNDLINPADFLPENALAQLTDADAPENVISAANVINTDNTAQSIVINGAKPLYIPVETTTASLSFNLDNNGYAALNLPFDVTNAEVTDLQTASFKDAQLLLVPATRVEAGNPVVVQDNVNISRTNAKLVAGDWQEQQNINILAADGQSVVPAETASPFMFDMNNATAIRAIDASGAETNKTIQVYDITGRRITAPTRAGIYIINGRKAAVNK